jgi:DNA-binding transcriptional MerR regulator
MRKHLTLTLRQAVCLYSELSTMENYTVKKLSDLAGVSVRTLHLYDEIGLLKPSVRTGAGYRLYGEKELLRLQQILFYRALNLSLQEITAILNDPEFDILGALESHEIRLREKQQNIETLLHTINNTIQKLKNGMSLNHEELYDGLPRETAEAWRKEAIEKYGDEAIQRSENSLKRMTKDDFARLKAESIEISEKLASLDNENPDADIVQKEIAKHYVVIRKFWGTHGEKDNQAEAYEGLGKLYVEDERFTMAAGKPNPVFANFMCKAMGYFVKTKLS